MNSKIVQHSLTFIIDCLVIVMETSYFLTFLPSFTLYKINHSLWFVLCIYVIFFHILRFGLNFNFLGKVVKSKILVCFFLLYFVEILQHIDTMRIFIFINSLVFMSYLYNVYAEKKSIRGVKSLLLPYICFSYYNMVAIIIVAALLLSGKPYEINPIPDSDPLMAGHWHFTFGTYFPYHLSIAMDYHLISLFGIPVLSGLCHEPHVIMYLITPAYIFTIGFINNKKVVALITVVFLFILLNALSTTAILCFFFVMSINFLWLARNNFYIILGIAAVLLLFGAIIIKSDIIDLLSMQLDSKIGSSSEDTSKELIMYLFRFGGLFGEGNFPVGYGRELKGSYAGLFTSILDITLYIYILISSFKAILSPDKEKHYVGLGCFYYALHSTKMGFQLFTYPFFIYMLFIIYSLNKVHFK